MGDEYQAGEGLEAWRARVRKNRKIRAAAREPGTPEYEAREERRAIAQIKYEAKKQKNRDQHAALKAEGGPAYEKWRLGIRNYMRERRVAGLDTSAMGKLETRLRRIRKRFIFSRSAAKRRGLEFTIEFHEIDWVDTCPVLGIPIFYGLVARYGKGARDNAASLDRWDNSLGYVPGNVFVISFKANRIKSNLSAAELQAVANYTKTKPGTSMEGLDGLI